MRWLFAVSLAVGCVTPDLDQTDSDAGAPGINSADSGVGDAQATEPSEDNLRDALQALSDIAHAHDGHRSAASAGYDASVDFVVTTLEGFGLAPYTHTFILSDFRLLDEPVLSIGASHHSHGEDYLVIDGSGSAELTAAAVAVDVQIPPGAEGNTDSGCEAQDFEDFPQGAIAVIQRGGCTFQQKIDHAIDAGAVAVVIFNEGQADRRDLFQAAIDDDNPADRPLIAATYELGVAPSEATELVTLSVLAEQISVEQDNVLVEVPGTTGDHWMLGAHLDSVAHGPGINDNGSGVALELEIARLLAQSSGAGDGVTLAFWGGEEVGLVGSMAWVGDQSEDTLESLSGYLNYDMVGSPNPARFVYDGDGSDTPWGVENRGPAGDIEQVFVDWYDAQGIGSLPTLLDGRSDYLGFMYAGVPSGGLFSGASESMTWEAADAFGGHVGESYDPCYHQSCDDIDNIDFAMLAESTGAAWDVLEVLRRR